MLFGLYLAPGMALAYPGGSIGRRFRRSAGRACRFGVDGRGRRHHGACAELARPDRRASGGRRRRRADQRLDVENGDRLVRGARNRHRHGRVREFLAGRDCRRPRGLAADRRDARAKGGILCFLPCLCSWAWWCWRNATRLQPRSSEVAVEETLVPERAALKAAIVAGSIWGLYNAGLAMVFAFSPSLLVEQAGRSQAPDRPSA